MMLTPVFKSADPMFNYRAADAAARMVMGMDEEEARAFTTQVVADILWDDISKNQKTLQTHLNTVVAKRLEMVAKAADRVISKRDGNEFGEALVEISKATRNPYDWGYVFNESDFNRDRSTGRFRAKVNYAAKAKPVDDKVARATPTLPNPKKTKDLTRQQKAEYQQGYQQIATFLDTMRTSGMSGDAQVYAHVRDKNSGRVYTTEVSGTKVPDIDPTTERFVGIEARPTSLRVGGASFGLVSALGGSTHAAGQAGATAQAVDDGVRTFADDWTTAGIDHPELSNARLYGRVEAGSKFLGQIAPAGSKLQMAGAFGEFVGRQGPQAERVLGPRARTTMYRYRGTEKTPDKELTSQYNRALRGYDIDRISPSDKKKIQGMVNSRAATLERQKGRPLTKDERGAIESRIMRTALGQTDKDAVQQSEAGQVRALQIAQRFMAEKIPEKKLYDLNLKSGHTPPSEGIIIDSSGKVVTQAIGYGDDHYLPFNLKNLKGLRGGEYVRTRSVGGPTTEDIYTGLITGAKRVTVVSRSGTFTVEFDDTFRGTRRYNDKAGRMIDRYGKLLDAVKSEQVERQPLDPAVRAEIAHGVEMEFGDWTSSREKRKIVQQREAEYKENPRLTEREESQIETRVAQIGGSDEDRNRIRATFRNEILESKSYNYRLNGDGYAASLDALKEQFPYYIKETSHRPLREGRFENSTDRGYVKPRYNRPSGALEGYFDPNIAGEGSYTDTMGQKTGKFRADQVDFQNSRGRLTRAEPAPTTAEKAPEVPGGALTPTAAPATQAEIASDTIERAADIKTAKMAASDLRTALATAIPDPAKRGPMTDVLAMDSAQFEQWYNSPGNQKRYQDMVNTVVKPKAAEAGVTPQVIAYEAAQGLVGGEKFNRASHMNTVPTQPYSFDGAAYLRGGNVAKKEAELQRVAHRTKVPDFGSLADIQEDSDFREALRTAQDIRLVADQVSQAPPEQRGSFLQAIIQNDPTAAAMKDKPDQMRLLTNPEKVDQMIEDINRAWALRKLISRSQPKGEQLTSTGRAREAEAVPRTPPMPTTLQQANLGRVEQAETRALTNLPANRNAMRDYSTALATLAGSYEDQPGIAESLLDIANDFDVAAGGDADTGARALEDLNILQEDIPELKPLISAAVMRQMRERYR